MDKRLNFVPTPEKLGPLQIRNYLERLGRKITFKPNQQ